MRLVVDSNIAISGLLWFGAPRTLMDLAFAGSVSLIVSPEMVAELQITLERPKFRPKFEAMGSNVRELLRAYLALAKLVEPAPLQAFAPDPDDDWIIATAIAAEADLIVTGDKPFLSVGSVEKVRIVTVVEALELVGD